MDLRAAYRFRIGGPRNLDLMFDVFNLTNRANFTNPLGDRRNASTFLVVTSLVDGGPTWTMQLNARFTF